jgi:hypothetical protein
MNGLADETELRSGEDVEKIVSGFFKVDSAVVATLRQLLAPKP